MKDKKQILLEEFKERRGYGACGFSLRVIATRIAELYDSQRIKINVPYHEFNCKGAADKVARDVIGIMPFSKSRVEIEDTTSFFYRNTPVTRGSYIPFLSDCDVYFIESVIDTNAELEINLTKAPNWRMYL